MRPFGLSQIKTSRQRAELQLCSVFVPPGRSPMPAHDWLYRRLLSEQVRDKTATERWNSRRRRKRGAIYTPPLIVNAMIGWAERCHQKPKRVVDCGAGSGRFLMAAALRFPHAELVAVDIDPLSTLMLRANAKVLGFSD